MFAGLSLGAATTSACLKTQESDIITVDWDLLTDKSPPLSLFLCVRVCVCIELQSPTPGITLGSFSCAGVFLCMYCGK